MTLRTDLRAALARGVEAQSSIAAHAALRRLDPLLCSIARWRLGRLLERTRRLTIDDSPAHRLRVAALLLGPAAPPELDFDDAEAVARAFDALGPLPGPRPRGPWFTLGSIASLALLAAVIALAARWLRPFDPRSSTAGYVLGDGLASFVVKTSNGVTGSALNETRAQLTSPLAEQALGADTVGALGRLLDAAGWVALAKDDSAGGEIERFHNAGNDLAALLRRRNLPYFVDVETLRQGPRTLPLLMSFYVQRESEYRAGSARVRALDLWRLDTLRVRFGALGYTRPRTPAALVLLDQIESDLVQTVLPAVAPGEPAQLVDDETREQGLPWVGPLERSAGEAVRKHFASLSADPHVLEVAGSLAKRRALVRRWRATLADGRHQLRVPERLIPEADYSSDLHLRVPNSELYAWDELHSELMSKQNYAAFLRLREPYVLGIERHEVEHRLDFARGFRPVPALLCQMLRIEDPLDAPVGSMQERVSAEFSAYLAQLVEAPDSPVLELIVLSTHLLDARSGGGVYWYAALGVLSAVSTELGLAPEQLIGHRVERERVATLLMQIIVQDPSTIRTAAAHAYERAYGEPVPHAVKQIVHDNAAWRH